MIAEVLQAHVHPMVGDLIAGLAVAAGLAFALGLVVGDGLRRRWSRRD